MEFPAQFIVGPTAAGKSAVAHFIACKNNLTLLSSDAMYVYRGMDIGTAKPTVSERSELKYLGIDGVDPSESFSLAGYLQGLQSGLVADEPVLVCGGTGLYVKTLLLGLDQRSTSDLEKRACFEKIYADSGVSGLQAELKKRNLQIFTQLADPENPRRLIRALEQMGEGSEKVSNWKDMPLPTVTGLTMPREILHQRIERRAKKMFNEGLLDEVRGLLKTYGDLSATARQAIGYAEALQVLAGEMTEADALERTIIRTRQLVKKQMTWFRHQLKVDWIEWDGSDNLEDLSSRIENSWNKHGDGTIRL